MYTNIIAYIFFYSMLIGLISTISYIFYKRRKKKIPYTNEVISKVHLEARPNTEMQYEMQKLLDNRLQKMQQLFPEKSNIKEPVEDLIQSFKNNFSTAVRLYQNLKVNE